MKVMAPHPIRLALALATSVAGLSVTLCGQTNGAQDGASAPGGVVQMAPITVTPDYSTITVRAILSGRNLFDPANDGVLSLTVVKVASDGDAGRQEFEEGDQLMAINDTALAGLSLKQIADALAGARHAGLPIFKIRRGLAVINIPFGGKWDPALPGLTH